MIPRGIRCAKERGTMDTSEVLPDIQRTRSESSAVAQECEGRELCPRLVILRNPGVVRQFAYEPAFQKDPVHGGACKPYLSPIAIAPQRDGALSPR